nr:MAG TPA: hypothetical protein [Caudoviricetes sp.]
MKGVIFHNKAENEVYMVHTVAGEFALCFNISCHLDTYRPFCVETEMKLISLRQLSTMSASLNVGDNIEYIDFYFGDDLVEEYFEEYKNLLEELAKR